MNVSSMGPVETLEPSCIVYHPKRRCFKLEMELVINHGAKFNMSQKDFEQCLETKFNEPLSYLQSS